jgi:hypothetical protein
MRKGKSRVAGVARGLELRTSENDQTLVFRVDQYDSAGNRLPAVAVQFASLRQGNVSEGEEVSVWGTFRHGTLHAHRVVNLTTGAALQGPAVWERLGLILALLFIAAVFIFLAFMFIKGIGGG